MSSGLELVYLKDPRDGKWYYILQNWDCPAQCWDWMEYATATGPFDNEDSARRYFSMYEQNAGGSMNWSPKKLEGTELGLVENARSPKRLWSKSEQISESFLNTRVP